MRLGFEMALKNKLLQKTNSLQSEETVLMRSFRYFDSNADGYVSMHEWFKGIEKIGVVVPTLEDLKQLFAYYDADGDGKINYKEFCDVVFKRKSLTPSKAAVAAAPYGEPEPETSRFIPHLLLFT